MRNLNFELKQLCNNARDGSRATQVDRERLLTLMANQLHEIGFRGLQAASLKPKHVQALVKRWRNEDVSAGTFKNRMAALRWWARKVNKQNVVARSNEAYGIEQRRFVCKESKATQVTDDQLMKIQDPYARMSVELQQAFGLRREEAIKFKPSVADQGDYIALKPAWTKGGKARIVPIINEQQRAVLDRAHRLAGRGSLIPPHLRYIQQRRVYDRHTAAAGLTKLHGLRHDYAQNRYRALTGWPAAAAGGPRSSTFSDKQTFVDHRARLIVSRELGHSRESISVVYLGR